MADEHESAVAAWLDNPQTQREVAIIRKRFPTWRDYEVYSFALQIETLASLDVYEIVDLPPDDPPDNEPWKRAA
jgi:hypothetical protein